MHSYLLLWVCVFRIAFPCEEEVMMEVKKSSVNFQLQ